MVSRRLVATYLLLAVVLSAGKAARVDTVGWTDRDRQVLGPSCRYIVNDTLRGLHAVWKNGLGEIRYSFRPRGRDWRWPGGVLLSPYSRNLGGMDVDLTTGQAVIGADYVSRGSVRGSFFRDSAAGSGRFSEAGLGTGFRRVVTATSRYGYARFGALRGDSLCHLSHFSSLRLDPSGPFPTHSLAGSRTSSRFCHIWSRPDGPDAGALMLKETPNNGQDWYATVNLSDTSGQAESRAPLGGQAVYDSIRLYVVTTFHDGRNPNRGRIWFYAKYDSPAWYPVHDFELPDTADIGDYALGAGRPTIGRNQRTGELFVVWEQFDPDNVEPRTGLCRADVWAVRSRDGGRTWGEPVRLTGPDSVSRRFPFLADVVDDSLRILCFADRCAGFWEQGQGSQTANAVLVISAAVDEIPAAVDEAPAAGRLLPVSLSPVVSRRGFDFLLDEPQRVRAFDAAGRLRARDRLDGRVSNWGHELSPGVWTLEFDPAGPGPAQRVRVIRLP